MQQSTDVIMRKIQQIQRILTQYGKNRYWQKKMNQLTAEMETRNVLNFSQTFIWFKDQTRKNHPEAGRTSRLHCIEVESHLFYLASKSSRHPPTRPPWCSNSHRKWHHPRAWTTWTWAHSRQCIVINGFHSISWWSRGPSGRSSKWATWLVFKVVHGKQYKTRKGFYSCHVNFFRDPFISLFFQIMVFFYQKCIMHWRTEAWCHQNGCV